MVVLEPQSGTNLYERLSPLSVYCLPRYDYVLVKLTLCPVGIIGRCPVVPRYHAAHVSRSGSFKRYVANPGIATGNFLCQQLVYVFVRYWCEYATPLLAAFACITVELFGSADSIAVECPGALE